MNLAGDGVDSEAMLNLELLSALPEDVASPYTERRRLRNCDLLLSMPTDVVLEVFGHLRPQDLLTLARTSKSLRAILLSRRTSLSAWIAAQQNLATREKCLPRPPHVSEPRWAYFLSPEMRFSCLICQRMPHVGFLRRYRLPNLLSHLSVIHPDSKARYGRDWVEVGTRRDLEKFSRR